MISSKACRRALPFSSWIRSSTSSCRSSRSSAKRSSTFARSVTCIRAQPGCAPRAVSAAAATSSGVPCGTCPSILPVAGISTGTGSLGPAVTARAASRPSMPRVTRGPRSPDPAPAEGCTDVVIASTPSGAGRDEPRSPGGLTVPGDVPPQRCGRGRRYGRVPRLDGLQTPVGGAQGGAGVRIAPVGP
jgi:hypothetical protein